MRVAGPPTLQKYGGTFLAFLCVLLYVPPALTTPFYTKGEPREALVVRRMVEDGDWILPRRPSMDGLTVASKPPLFHWLGAAVSKVVGTSEVSVRLPSIVLASGTVLMVWWIGRAMLGAGAALMGAIMLAQSFEWLRAASTARVDAALAALTTMALLIFYRGFVRGGLSVREALAAYLCIAAAALVKGPVGVVLPGLVLVVAVLIERDPKKLLRFHPFLGGAVVLTLVGGWYAAAVYAGGDAFVQRQILKENVFRYLAATKLKSGHDHPFYYYVPTLAAGFLPWTPVVIAALVAAIRDQRSRANPRIVFLVVWFAAVFVFYSIAAAKRSVYLLALYPAGALLAGWWWQDLVDARYAPRWLQGRAATVIAGIATALVVVPLALVLAEGAGFSPFQLIGPLLKPKDRANLPVVQSIVDSRLVLILFLLAFMLGTIVALRASVRNAQPRGIFASSAACTLMLWILVFTVFQPTLARARTLKPFLAEVGWRTGGAPLAFHPSTFDFGAAFYAPHEATRGMDIVSPSDDDDDTGVPTPASPAPGAAESSAYLLIWDDALAALPPEERAGLVVVATSTGTDPKGKRHLVLVRTLSVIRS